MNMNIEKAHHRSEEILKIKLKTCRKSLCLGLPSFFNEAFNYIDRLKPQATLNYEYLSKLFSSVNGCFPQINLFFEPEEIVPKAIQFRRSFSQKEKK
jgi:hypothetical protein